MSYFDLYPVNYYIWIYLLTILTCFLSGKQNSCFIFVIVFKSKIILNYLFIKKNSYLEKILFIITRDVAHVDNST